MSPSPPSTESILAAWNRSSTADAAQTILPCNGSPAWAAAMADARPLPTPADCLREADNIWFRLTPQEWQQAFDSHPRIGEQHAQAASAQSLQWSAAEQQQASPPDAAIKTQLAEANRRYEQQFGRIFIVCASGKSAAQMLAILLHRLRNDPSTELHEAAEQQRQITQLRLRKWLGIPAWPSRPSPSTLESSNQKKSMGLSTHILDTALGRPAAGVAVTLSQLSGDLRLSADLHSWQLIGSGHTDADGRCKTLLGETSLEPVTYKLHFATAAYFAAAPLPSLYPFVEIVFTVTDAAQHHHIPLLLTANGYTTYRGS